MSLLHPQPGEHAKCLHCRARGPIDHRSGGSFVISPDDGAVLCVRCWHDGRLCHYDVVRVPPGPENQGLWK